MNNILHSGMQVALRRILYTVGVIFIYTSIYNINYTGSISAMHHSSNIKSYVTDINITSVLSQATRPYIFANVVMNMLSIVFEYFEKLKSDTENRWLYDIFNIGIMLFFSITQSIMNISYVDQYVLNDYKNMFFLHYSIINLVSSLFVAWFNRQLVLNGLGYGVTLIISLQIINGFISKHKIINFFDIFSLITINQFAYLLLMFLTLVVVEKFVIKIPLVALTTYDFQVRPEAAKSDIEYKPANTNIISNILALQTINLLMILIFWIIKNNFWSYFNSYFLSNIISHIVVYYQQKGTITNQFFILLQYFLYFTLLLSYNYIYSTAYHSPHKMVISMRKNICYIPYVGIGNRSEKLIDNIAMISSLIAVLITLYIISFPLFLNYLFNCEGILGGIDIMIISGSFMYLIEFTKSVYIYSTYSFDSSVLVKKNYIQK